MDAEITHGASQSTGSLVERIERYAESSQGSSARLENPEKPRTTILPFLTPPLQQNRFRTEAVTTTGRFKSF
jgi:hypothetical protein